MDLVNEYLRAVAALLPKAQREDIIAELRDTILSRIEERGSELGRPLTDDEVEAVLREVGHPVVIAARYREGPQHVVGPALYPYWLLAVKAAIALQVATAVVVIFVRTLAFGNFSRMVSDAVGSSVTGTLVLIGAATCTAWFLERRGARIAYLDNWRVRDLRMLEIVVWDFDTLRQWFGARPSRPRPGQAGRGPRRPGPPSPPAATPSWHPAMRPMARGLALVAAGTLLVLWWTGVLPLGLGLDTLDWATLQLNPGALGRADWGTLRAMLFWPVIAYGAVFVLQGGVMIAHPQAVRLSGGLEAAKGAALLGFCIWIWTASPLASVVSVSRPEFAARMALLRESPPLPMEPLATLAVLGLGLVACSLIGRGLWSLVFGGPPAYPNVTAPPGASSSSG